MEEKKVLTYEELTSAIWEVADIIRDEVDGDTRDYMELTLPLLLVKRILDTREEYIDNVLKNTSTFEMVKGDLLKVLSIEKKTMPMYNVSGDLKRYFITWKDIVSYIDNKNNEEITLPLKKYSDISIKTKAKTQQHFLSEVLEGFENKKINRIIKDSGICQSITNLDKIKEETFNKIMSAFNELTFSFELAPSDIFSDGYMYLIEKFATTAGKKGGEFFTPKLLCQGAIKLLNPTLKEVGHTSVADITAGSATFLKVYLDYIRTNLRKEMKNDNKVEETINSKCKFYLQEKTNKTLILGEMNLLLATLNEDNFTSYTANSISEYTENIGQHRNTIDYVVGNPPYGLKDYCGSYFGPDFKKKKYNSKGNEDRWKWGIAPKGEGEMAFVETFIDMLNNEGRGVIVLPLGTLFKDSTKHIRQKMIKEGLIEGLVLLPDNMFMTTGIPVVLWVLNKNKIRKNKDKIFMINASEHFTKEGKFKVWNQNESVDAFHNKKEIEGFSGYVSLEDIEENDFNISVQRYVFKEEKEEDIDIEQVSKEIDELEKQIAEKKVIVKSAIEQVIQIQKNKS